jgi:lipopolysaccharide biosynthesis glycosyltransferase
MLDSFIHRNPWFKGDIVVIQDQLPAQEKSYLTLRFPHLQFLQVSSELKAAIAKLVVFNPSLKRPQARFFSLDLFRLNHYQQLLFCDSDLLFLDSIEPLFQTQKPLIACGDGAYYWDKAIKKDTFTRVDPPQTLDENILIETFNAGLMVFNQNLLSPTIYSQILQLLDPLHWQAVESEHTDQAVFNRYFAGQQQLVGPEYNYLMGHRQIIWQKSGIGLDAAKVIHFNKRCKPWLANHTLQTTLQDPAYIKALRYWYNAHIDCLQRLHLYHARS